MTYAVRPRAPPYSSFFLRPCFDQRSIFHRGVLAPSPQGSTPLSRPFVFNDLQTPPLQLVSLGTQQKRTSVEGTKANPSVGAGACPSRRQHDLTVNREAPGQPSFPPNPFRIRTSKTPRL